MKYLELYNYLKDTYPTDTVWQRMLTLVEVSRCSKIIRQHVEDYLIHRNIEGYTTDYCIKLDNKVTGKQLVLTHKHLVKDLHMDPIEAFLYINYIQIRPELASKYLKSRHHYNNETDRKKAIENADPKLLDLIKKMQSKGSLVEESFPDNILDDNIADN